MQEERSVREAPGSRQAVRAMPEKVRWVLGRALRRVQRGPRPPGLVPLRGELKGIVEVRAEHMGDTFPLYYTIKCQGFVHVLFCHKKKSSRAGRIARHERDLIARRYRDALRDCSEHQGGVQ